MRAIPHDPPPRPGWPWVGICLAGLLSAYQALAALQFYVTDSQRIAYTGIAGLLAVAFLLQVPQVRLEPRAWNLVFVWTFLCILPFFPALSHRPPILGYIVGDFATLTVPLMFLVVGLRFPDAFALRPTILLLAAGLLFASLVGLVSSASGNERHEAPAAFLIAAAWMSLFFSRAPWKVLVSGAVIAFLAFAAASSGYRSSMIHVALMGAMTYYLRGGANRVALYFAFAIAALVGVALVAPPEFLNEQVRRMRIASILEGATDASITARFDEAYDVGQQIRDDWSAINYLVGTGHGATFVPIRSNPERNITAYGTVHNIHATPVLLFYRYGLLGLTAFLAVLVVAVRRYFAIRQGVRDGEICLAEVALTLAMLAYLADSFKHVTLVDPVFSFTLAGLIWLELRPPRRQPLASHQTLLPFSG